MIDLILLDELSSFGFRYTTNRRYGSEANGLPDTNSPRYCSLDPSLCGLAGKSAWLR